jgi:hypothetical protein
MMLAVSVKSTPVQMNLNIKELALIITIAKAQRAIK